MHHARSGSPNFATRRNQMQHQSAHRYNTGLAYGDRHQGILAEEFGKAPERPGLAPRLSVPSMIRSAR